MTAWEILGGFAAAFFTLAIFSFLWKDNPIYKMAEHIFVGVAAGYGMVVAYRDILYPMLYLDVVHEGHWLRLGAGIFGILLLLRLVPRVAWVSRIPIALIVGAFAGLRLVGAADGEIVGQTMGTMRPLYQAAAGGGADLGGMLSHAIIVFGLVAVLGYFFFSLEHRGPLGWLAKIGILVLMITFGAHFGFTVLGRVTLLIGRARKLEVFASRSYGYATFFCLVLVVGGIAFWEIRARRKRRAAGEGEPPA